MTIPSGYAQVNFIFTGAAVPNGAECTMGFDIGGGAGTPALTAQEVGADFATHILPNLSSGLTLSGVRCKYGPDATGAFALEPFANVGGVGTSGATPAIAILIHKNTADGGRAGRGRMYLPGVVEAQPGSDGVLAGATITAVDSDFASVLSAWTADGHIPVVLHGAGSPLSVPSVITSFSTDATVGTQRRRQRR